jgi:hypothetical protein
MNLTSDARPPVMIGDDILGASVKERARVLDAHFVLNAGEPGEGPLRHLFGVWRTRPKPVPDVSADIAPMLTIGALDHAWPIASAIRRGIEIRDARRDVDRLPGEGQCAQKLRAPQAPGVSRTAVRLRHRPQRPEARHFGSPAEPTILRRVCGPVSHQAEI